MMSELSSPTQAHAASALDEVQAKGSAAWETKKFREEYDVAKGKLVDAKFDPGQSIVTSQNAFIFADPKIAEYPDPLLPRPGIKAAYARSFPPGTEERLKKLVAKVEGKST